MSGATWARVDAWDSDLSAKQHGDPQAVLAEVRRSGRFSSFEMTNTLWQTLQRLAATGDIQEVPREYPVIQFRITPPPTTGADAAGDGR